MARRKITTGRALAILAARLAQERHATDMLVLDLRQISPVADYFVICTGTSDRQMRSLAEEMVSQASQSGQKVFNVAGLDSAGWVLLDFVDVVIHIFGPAQRQYYALEMIWGDAPHVRWQPRGQRAAPSGDSDDDQDSGN